jgi:23S rRNA (cytidine1920-2'-O)/16S rRNA (cytidine1409-2'-O)-methyltransferase
MAQVKKRADEWAVERGLAETRSKAQALILAGELLYRVPGRQEEWVIVPKPGHGLPQECELKSKREGPVDVGRGAQKLRGAFMAWPEASAAARDGQCLDIGSSTGGFTQVLLEAGARRVMALDVGTHQLHERLRSDPRVHSVEQQHVLKIDAAYWAASPLRPPFDVIVTDLSFISLDRVIPHAAPWLRPGGHWILLVKPQFELDRKKVPKGVVKDPAHRDEAVAKIRSVVESESGLLWEGLRESPIEGGDGNKEFLAWVTRQS